MRLSTYIVLFVLASGLACGTTHAADLPVALVSESSLPFSLSPAHFDNSPSNFDNSISNFDNSSSNVDNSESNFENSASNYENGPNGKRRLIYNEDGTSKFVGYYVAAKNGTTNFYSPSGKRMFYNPKKGFGVFGAKDGDFCGALVRVKGEISLALTEHGAKVLFLSQ